MKKFIFPRDRELLSAYLLDLKVPHKIEISKVRKGRSLAQNSLLHIWMREIARKYEEHYGEWSSPEEYKDWFKQKFLEPRPISCMGQTIWKRPDTSDLEVHEFSIFLDRIDRFCVQKLKILLSRPEEYREAVQEKYATGGKQPPERVLMAK